MDTKYDYIFTGLGAAGFSLLLRLIKMPNFSSKKVLLIDQDTKKKNDRTWCFWEEGDGFFEDIVSHKWSNLEFHSPKRSKNLDLSPYSYKMIKGKEFYDYCWGIISQHSNIIFHQDQITSINDDNSVACEEGNFIGTYVFNSAVFKIKPTKKDKHLLQHFLGYVISTPHASFNENKPTLMDFRVHQNNGCSFVYVMPLSDKKALVEYTVFSRELLEDGEYQKEVKDYIKTRLKLENYDILEEEFGVIPMTTAKFKARNSNSVINIGTAGGQTKASTGYTFVNIQERSELIARNLIEGHDPLHGLKTEAKFNLYDATLLNIMNEGKYPIWKAFDDMFNKLSPKLVLDFLGNKTNLFQDIRIMSSVHTPTFLKSAIQTFFN